MLKSHSFRTPPLKVSRPVSACSRCRTAKVKCDGRLPSCGACDKSGRAAECSSANDQFARGKERNYVASLEVRVEKLERQLEAARGRKVSVTILGLDPSHSAAARPITKKPKGQRREASHVDDLVSDFGFLSINATARDFHGFTREMSFARLVLYTSSLRTMPQATGLPLPTRVLITPLIQYYIDTVLVLYPFLSETAIFAALAEHQGSQCTPMARWTVPMVAAISLASMWCKRGDQRYVDAVSHVAEAFQSIEAVVQPGSMQGIQSLLLLVIYAMLDPHHFNSWYLIGIASRVTVDLGLHQELPSDTQTPRPHLDFRRRVFHSVYALDRAISLVHRRAFSFTDDSVNVKPDIPSNEQSFAAASNPALQLLRLRKLQSAAYQRLYLSNHLAWENPWPFISISFSEMRSWAEHVPDTTNSSLKWLLLSELEYGCILIMCAPALTRKPSEYAKALTFEHAVQYADCMISLIEMTDQSTLYTSHDVLRASHIGDRFLDVLEAEGTCVMTGVPPAPPILLSGSSPLPILQRRSVSGVIDQALSCLNRLEQVLEHLCTRYEYPELLADFRTRSTGSLRLLHMRRGVYGMPPRHELVSGSPQIQQEN